MHVCMYITAYTCIRHNTLLCCILMLGIYIICIVMSMVPSNICIHLIQVLYLCSICVGATYIIIQCSCTYVLAYSCTMTHYDTHYNYCILKLCIYIYSGHHAWVGLKDYMQDCMLHDLFVVAKFTLAAQSNTLKQKPK